MNEHSIYENGWCCCKLESTTELKSVELIDGVEDLFSLHKDIKSQYKSGLDNPHEGWRLPESKNRPSEVWQIRRSSYKKNLPGELHHLGEISFDIIDNILFEFEELFLSAFKNGMVEPRELFQSIKEGVITVRFLFYNNSKSNYSFEEHTDFGIASIFLCESQPGLELKRKDGSWSRVKLSPSDFVLAFGDMSEFISEGQVPAAIHKVSHCEKDRYSIAFFLQPEDNFIISKPSNNSFTSKDFFEEKFKQVMRRK